MRPITLLMDRSISNAERYGWILVMSMLVVFAIPWFLWGDSRVVAGLPLWLWWHICWMIAATFVFALFASRAWGLGITDTSDPDREGGLRA